VVVEVGIDVPEATVMVVEGAERFGLATLHQLRGRVGRGERPGTAFLVPAADAASAPPALLERLRLLEREPDGFRIAEADLAIRGPGEWCGVRQHGMGGPLPVGAHGDAELVSAVDAAASALLAARYDPAADTYYAALGRTLAGGFDPKDAV
jgi:ATP-dependent DNA helicase RecG